MSVPVRAWPYDSNLAVQELLEGKDVDMMPVIVDVRDVAAAHVRAAEVGCSSLLVYEGAPQSLLCISVKSARPVC